MRQYRDAQRAQERYLSEVKADQFYTRHLQSWSLGQQGWVSFERLENPQRLKQQVCFHTGVCSDLLIDKYVVVYQLNVQQKYLRDWRYALRQRVHENRYKDLF